MKNIIDLTDLGRTFHPTTEYISFSMPHETFSRIDHRLDHKTSLSKLKMTEIIPTVFSDHNGMKLLINNRRKAGKFTNKKHENETR